RSRQCISATVSQIMSWMASTHASFGSDRPLCRACHHSRLPAHAVIDRRDTLPTLADLLVLYGRGDRPARALGGRRDGHWPALPLPPLGQRRVRSGARGLAPRRTLVAALDFCRPRRGRKRQFFSTMIASK